MLDYKLKIALIPLRRDVVNAKTRAGAFRASNAIDNKNRIIKYIKDNFTDEITTFTDLEWLNDEGLLISTNECERVRDYLISEKVDAIILINCNFGNEEAAGQIARMMRLPILLWGIRDTEIAPDGTRYTDAQCGLFAISKQLQRYKLPFSYINNCHIEDVAFTGGLKSFLSVATMVRNFNRLRITLVGTRMNPFKSVMYNELELTEKFGINLQNVNMSNLKDCIADIIEKNETALKKDVEIVKEKYNTDSISDDELVKMLAFVYYYKNIFELTSADVLASECWTSMPPAIGVYPCLAMSILADMGYSVCCESDIHGAVTNALLLSAARGSKPAIFGEFTIRHPEDKNSELLWHCGPFPYSSKCHSSCAKIDGGKPCFKAKDGTYTIARFQGSSGKYYLFGGEFETCDGPYTSGTYMWAKFNDLDALESKLINGPYIHHMTEMYGRYYKELKELCKYIPGLEFDDINEEKKYE